MTFLNALLISSVYAGLLLIVVGSTLGVLKITTKCTDNECAPFITLTVWFTFFFALLIYAGENYK